MSPIPGTGHWELWEPWAARMGSGAAQCVSTHPSVGCAGACSGLPRGISDTSESPGGLHALEGANNPWKSRENIVVWVYFPTLFTLLQYSDNFRVVEMCLPWNSSLRSQCCYRCSKTDIRLSSHGVFLCAGRDF